MTNDDNKPDPCLEEFVTLALKHSPRKVLAATVMVQAMTFSTLHDTVTEAIDGFRKTVPITEGAIRVVFPKVADAKEAWERGKAMLDELASEQGKEALTTPTGPT